jgi:hypothetical protein
VSILCVCVCVCVILLFIGVYTIIFFRISSQYSYMGVYHHGISHAHHTPINGCLFFVLFCATYVVLISASVCNVFVCVLTCFILYVGVMRVYICICAESK